MAHLARRDGIFRVGVVEEAEEVCEHQLEENEELELVTDRVAVGLQLDVQHEEEEARDRAEGELRALPAPPALHALRPLWSLPAACATCSSTMRSDEDDARQPLRALRVHYGRYGRYGQYAAHVTETTPDRRNLRVKSSDSMYQHSSS